MSISINSGCILPSTMTGLGTAGRKSSEYFTLIMKRCALFTARQVFPMPSASVSDCRRISYMTDISLQTEDHGKAVAHQSLVWLQEGGFL